MLKKTFSLFYVLYVLLTANDMNGSPTVKMIRQTSVNSDEN